MPTFAVFAMAGETMTVMLRHRPPNLSRVELVALTAEIERRGYRLISAESMASIDRMTPADPKVLDEISTALRSIPGLCREVAEKSAEVDALHDQLTRAHAAAWWTTQGELDKRLGAMALA
jgi:hypothetical protein